MCGKSAHYCEIQTFSHNKYPYQVTLSSFPLNTLNVHLAPTGDVYHHLHPVFQFFECVHEVQWGQVQMRWGHRGNAVTSCIMPPCYPHVLWNMHIQKHLVYASPVLQYFSHTHFTCIQSLWAARTQTKAELGVNTTSLNTPHPLLTFLTEVKGLLNCSLLFLCVCWCVCVCCKLNCI